MPCCKRRSQLEKVRNDRQNQTSQWLTITVHCFWQTLPPLLLALAAVSRLELAVPLTGGPETLQTLLNSSYVIFFLATLFIWFMMVVAVRAQSRAKNRSNRRKWRVLQFWLLVATFGLIIGYFAVFIRSVSWTF